MRTAKYHIYLTNEEYRQAICSLIEAKNKLIVEGHYTDAVDDLLLRLSAAKKKKLKIV